MEWNLMIYESFMPMFSVCLPYAVNSIFVIMLLLTHNNTTDAGIFLEERWFVVVNEIW